MEVSYLKFGKKEVIIYKMTCAICATPFLSHGPSRRFCDHPICKKLRYSYKGPPDRLIHKKYKQRLIQRDLRRKGLVLSPTEKKQAKRHMLRELYRLGQIKKSEIPKSKRHMLKKPKSLVTKQDIETEKAERLMLKELYRLGQVHKYTKFKAKNREHERRMLKELYRLGNVKEKDQLFLPHNTSPDYSKTYYALHGNYIKSDRKEMERLMLKELYRLGRVKEKDQLFLPNKKSPDYHKIYSVLHRQTINEQVRLYLKKRRLAKQATGD